MSVPPNNKINATHKSLRLLGALVAALLGARYLSYMDLPDFVQ